MRKLMMIIAFLFALPAFAAKPITADQLEQFLANAHGKTDADLAYQIAESHLTERLSSVRLSAMQMQLPGDKVGRHCPHLLTSRSSRGRPL